MDSQPRADETFRSELETKIPHMRAFARSLCGDPTQADDLVQDALANAWRGRARYAPGTNLKAWLFMIVRNQFYSDKRRSWRQIPLDPETAEATLTAVSDPMAALELDEVRRALAMLPNEQREALILVGVAGLPYDEICQICGCAEGTIKSRVHRARARMVQILTEGFIARDGIEPSAGVASLMAAAERLQRRRAAA